MDEIHVFVVWDNKHAPNIIEQIQKQFEILRTKKFGPNEYNRVIELREGKADKRGKKGYTVIAVLDPTPKYAKVHREYIKSLPLIMVNTNIYSIKLKLRSQYNGYNTLHATNVLSEAQKALKIFGMEDLNAEPKK